MITLIATGHSEKGKCTSNELLKIIEQIAPDVIFEETPPDYFDRLYKNMLPDCLESKAIKMYLEKKTIAHFPVDLQRDDITEELAINDYGLISHILKHHSQEYLIISRQWELLPSQYGFPYLNSEQCAHFLEYKSRLESELVAKINHEELARRYQDWLNYHHERENEMIHNIYHYYAQNAFASALFLVGVEHRKSLVSKIAAFEKNKGIHLEWKFNYFG
jgi:hypothetical protein